MFDVRCSVNLLRDSNNILHLGAGYSHRKPESTVNFDAAAAGEGTDLIDIGTINAIDNIGVYSAELAAFVSMIIPY